MIGKKEPKTNLERTKLLEETLETFKSIVTEVSTTDSLRQLDKLESRGVSALQLMASQVGKASTDLYLSAKKRRGELRREGVAHAFSLKNKAKQVEAEEAPQAEVVVEESEIKAPKKTTKKTTKKASK